MRRVIYLFVCVNEFIFSFIYRVIFNISVSNAITKLHKVMKEISLISGMLQRLKCHGILFFLHLPEQVNGDK